MSLKQIKLIGIDSGVFSRAYLFVTCFFIINSPFPSLEGQHLPLKPYITKAMCVGIHTSIL